MHRTRRVRLHSAMLFLWPQPNHMRDVRVWGVQSDPPPILRTVLKNNNRQSFINMDYTSTGAKTLHLSLSLSLGRFHRTIHQQKPDRQRERDAWEWKKDSPLSHWPFPGPSFRIPRVLIFPLRVRWAINNCDVNVKQLHRLRTDHSVSVDKMFPPKTMDTSCLSPHQIETNRVQEKLKYVKVVR